MSLRICPRRAPGANTDTDLLDELRDVIGNDTVDADCRKCKSEKCEAAEQGHVKARLPHFLAHPFIQGDGAADRSR